MRKDDQPPALLLGEDGQLRVPVPTTRASCFERPGGSVRGERANITELVLGCIEAKFCKEILVGKLSPRSTQCTPLHRFWNPVLVESVWVKKYTKINIEKMKSGKS